MGRTQCMVLHIFKEYDKVAFFEKNPIQVGRSRIEKFESNKVFLVPFYDDGKMKKLTNTIAMNTKDIR